MILMIHAVHSLKPSYKRFMNIEHWKFINVTSIVNSLDKKISTTLPQLLMLFRGCDTTPYKYNTTKKSAVNKRLKNLAILSKTSVKEIIYQWM